MHTLAARWSAEIGHNVLFDETSFEFVISFGAWSKTVVVNVHTVFGDNEPTITGYVFRRRLQITLASE